MNRFRIEVLEGNEKGGRGLNLPVYDVLASLTGVRKMDLGDDFNRACTVELQGGDGEVQQTLSQIHRIVKGKATVTALPGTGE